MDFVLHRLLRSKLSDVMKRKRKFSRVFVKGLLFSRGFN